jgi:hypothetical protein
MASPFFTLIISCLGFCNILPTCHKLSPILGVKKIPLSCLIHLVTAYFSSPIS